MSEDGLRSPKSPQFTIDSSVWDGRLSIEHQLEVHANDLIQIEKEGQDLEEVLSGLQYVVDYRIAGKGMGLDQRVCEQLAKGLLLWTGKRDKSGGLFLTPLDHRPFRKFAEMAFALVADFANLIPEFATALVMLPPDELRRRLSFSSRLRKPSSEIILEAATSLLLILIAKGGLCLEQLVDERHIPEVVETLSLVRNSLCNHLRSGQPTVISLFPPPALYFDRSIGRVLDMFKTEQKDGLCDEIRIVALREHYGRNVLPKSNKRAWWRMLFDQFADFMIIVLLITVIVSAVVDFPEVSSAFILAMVVLLNVSFGFWQEYNSANIVASMQSIQSTSARVRRSGHDCIVPSEELVPGDIVSIAEGDYVPADLRLIETSKLEIRETVLTGESADVKKDTRRVVLSTRKAQPSRCQGNAFMGTLVARGTGLGVVVRTGINTEVGKIGNALNESSNLEFQSKSVLKEKLSFLTKILVILAIVLCLVVLVIGLIRGEDLTVMTRLSISLAVSVIPEGLVAVLTLAVALAIRRLAQVGILARRMNAVEGLGSITVIASDKTGTLTEGAMQLVDSWPSDVQKEILETCIICNNASLTADGRAIGDATEVALLQGAAKFGVKTVGRRLLEIPFDSERKMMSILFDPFQDGRFQQHLGLYCKGAAESVLTKCTSAMMDGKLIPLTSDEEYLRQIAEIENNWSGMGQRVLAVAYRKKFPESIQRIFREGLIPKEDEALDQLYSSLEKDLVFLGLVALIDPPRLGVTDSVRLCERAGIKVCMITGDHLRTATSIASRIGIYDQSIPSKSRAISGHDLDLLTEEGIASLHPFPSVFARVSPQNKLSIVRALQLRKDKVIMTGDGINDAPAIRQAEVGIAMGRSGTQITKDAAALILLDDNFSSIVRALGEGRRMYRIVTIFLLYLLSCNSAEIWTVLGAVILGWHPPLSAMNILWANAIADIPPSMCLCLEVFEEGALMSDSPVAVQKQIMSAQTWAMITFNGLLLSILTLLVYGLNVNAGEEQRRSEAFFILIGLQLLLAPLCRSPSQSFFKISPFGNPKLYLSVLFSFGLLLAGLYVPFLCEFLDLVPVGPSVWVKFLLSLMCMFTANELFKWILRKLKT